MERLLEITKAPAQAGAGAVYWEAPAANSVKNIIHGPAQLRKEDVGRVIKTLEIQTTPEQDKRMQDFIKRKKSCPGTYGVVGDNCVNAAEDFLHSGGVKTPLVPGLYPSNFMNVMERFSGKGAEMHDGYVPPK